MILFLFFCFGLENGDAEKFDDVHDGDDDNDDSSNDNMDNNHMDNDNMDNDNVEYDNMDNDNVNSNDSSNDIDYDIDDINNNDNDDNDIANNINNNNHDNDNIDDDDDDNWALSQNGNFLKKFVVVLSLSGHEFVTTAPPPGILAPNLLIPWEDRVLLASDARGQRVAGKMCECVAEG